MSIEEVRIRGYRSIRKLDLRLQSVTVVVGPNGSGKSNLYRAVQLLQAAARGTLPQALAEEGGLPSALWAGDRHRNDRARIELGVTTDVLSYDLALGFPRPGNSAFNLDGEVKEERLHGRAGTRDILLLERKGPLIRARTDEGSSVSLPNAVSEGETALSELRDPRQFSAVAAARLELQSWRFYHEFRTDSESPLRHPQIGCRTPVLAADGRDLAAALQTILEIGGSRELTRTIADAFPDSALEVEADRGRFSVRLRTPEIPRPFAASELSDGTLKYLCLLAALMTPRPPALLALNEPEASLHPDLLRPLAGLIAAAARYSQIWVTTHSEDLAGAIAAATGVEPVRLMKREGETTVVRGR